MIVSLTACVICWCSGFCPETRLPIDQVHHFSDIGYRHNSFTHCPARMRTNCACDAMQSVQFHTPSFGICHKRWSDFMDKPPHPKRSYSVASSSWAISCSSS